jgi:hypothetical protein
MTRETYLKEWKKLEKEFDDWWKLHGGCVWQPQWKFLKDQIWDRFTVDLNANDADLSWIESLFNTVTSIPEDISGYTTWSDQSRLLRELIWAYLNGKQVLISFKS